VIAATSGYTGYIEKVLGRKGEACEGAARPSLNMDAWARHEGADVFRHVISLVVAPFGRRDWGSAFPSTKPSIKAYLPPPVTCDET
jgi:hypothetical protein